MDREEAKEYVRAHAKEYLQPDKSKKGFVCPICGSGTGKTGTGISAKDGKHFTCWANNCFKNSDIIDIIGLQYGITNDKEKFNKAYELFNIEVEGSKMIQKHDKTEQKPNGKDCMAYFKTCQAHIKETDYPKKRGLSEQTITSFMLGYDSNYTEATGGKSWKALIIPTGRETYVARNTDSKANDRYRKHGASVLYNARVLKTAQKPIFITEGEIDALSIIEAGGEAIALGSTSNTNKLLKLLEVEKPAKPLLLTLDNDEAGKKATDDLKEGLKKLDIGFYEVSIYGAHKDANEALVMDRDAFVTNIQASENIEAEAQEAAKEAYLQASAANHLQSFINGIAASVNTPFIPTGFNKLDNALEGGLYEGLYIVGAISSLGKTTLVLQIGDQIAQQGYDVLIFSLEMARNELMAKSISRLTKLEAIALDGRTSSAKTTRGITTGSRYANYSQKEHTIINKAIKAYSEYAGNIYINEGIGNIGAAEIRETVNKHILFTGRTPVVVVDYLQILAPYSERSTDKQNTDKAVMELKRISRDFKVPVVGISSFNRASYKDAVTMEAFKESGAIEYSSDVLIGLQLKGVGTAGFDANKAKDKDPREIELVVLKNRNGATGKKIEYEYFPLFNDFKEI